MVDAQFNQSGDAIDYIPSVDVAAGTVVVEGDLIGVTKLDIKANTLGALALKGSYELAKETGAGMDIAIGTVLYWDDINQRVTKTAGSLKVFGKAITAASENDTTVNVRLANE